MTQRPARKGEPLASVELVYAANDASRRGSSVVVMFQLFSVPLIVGLIVSQLAGGTAALIAIVAAGGAAVWWWKRAPHAGGVVLRVEDGHLYVLSANRKVEKERFALDEVDVVLDTKTIQKVQEGGSAIPAMRFIDATVGPELDTARIVVVATSSRRRLALTEDYVTHMDATEWFGKIRVFLRKSGWIPADERAPESEAPESEAPASDA
jgi:hypothetical protein